MILDLTDLGAVGAIPGVGPILVGVSIVVEAIGAIFGLTFGGGDTQALATAVTQLQAQLTTAVQTLTRFAWSIANALGDLLQIVHDLLVGFIGTLWSLIKKLGGLLRNLYTTWLPALLKIIRQMRDFLNQVYLRYIRPILAWLQWARQWLAILRLFHIAWAGKLDGYLTQLQGWILTPYMYVLRSINGIGSWVNVIITTGGLIQRAVFINSMYAYQKDWISMWWNGQANAPAPPAIAPAPVASSAPSTAQVSGELDQFIYTGSGPIASSVATSMQYGNIALSQIPPGP